MYWKGKSQKSQALCCCVSFELRSSLQTPRTGEFYWTKYEQGIILASFYYGYMCTQIVAGRLADRFGGKHTIGTGILVLSVLTVLTPLAARTSFLLLVALRIVEGLAGVSCSMPTLNICLCFS